MPEKPKTATTKKSSVNKKAPPKKTTASKPTQKKRTKNQSAASRPKKTAASKKPAQKPRRDTKAAAEKEPESVKDSQEELDALLQEAGIEVDTGDEFEDDDDAIISEDAEETSLEEPSEEDDEEAQLEGLLPSTRTKDPGAIEETDEDGASSENIEDEDMDSNESEVSAHTGELPLEEEWNCSTCFILVSRRQFGLPQDPQCPSGEVICPGINRFFR